MSSTEEAAQKMRTAQKPLKDSYKSDPSSALVTLTSSGSLDPTSITCSLSTASAAKRVAGLHKNAGGTAGGEIRPDMSSELCSGDMLLESLVACFGVTVRAVSTAMSIPVQGGTITAEGDLDFRGTMGVKDENGGNVGVGFQRIRLKIRLEVDDSYKEQVEKLISLSERYCVVLQTLRSGVEVKTELGHVGRALPDARSNAELQNGGKDGGTDEQGLNDDEVLQLN